eukprot:TRINITY_DN86184_c0_g1_i2.p2 TRINITY_DN86184_c0_g1~~TRINITY_DN86184_c0_g1_i2.p2  ORF type:complete len:119 (-),score=17.97 TRINITY_DN86184_c0_g1_i2:74-430(-)
MPTGEVFTRVDDKQPQAETTCISPELRNQPVELGNAKHQLSSFRAYHAAYSKAKEDTVFRRATLPALGADDSDLTAQVSIRLKEIMDDPKLAVRPYFFLAISAYCERWIPKLTQETRQ